MRALVHGFSQKSRFMVKSINNALLRKHVSVMLPHPDLPANNVASFLHNSDQFDLIVIVGFSLVSSELEKEIVIVEAAIENKIRVFVIENKINSAVQEKAKKIAHKVDHVFVSSYSLLSKVGMFGYPSTGYICRPSQIEVARNSEKIASVIKEFVPVTK